MNNNTTPFGDSQMLIYQAPDGAIKEKVVCRNFRHTTQHGAVEGKTIEQEQNFREIEKDIKQLMKN